MSRARLKKNLSEKLFGGQIFFVHPSKIAMDQRQVLGLTSASIPPSSFWRLSYIEMLLLAHTPSRKKSLIGELLICTLAPLPVPLTLENLLIVSYTVLKQFLVGLTENIISVRREVFTLRVNDMIDHLRFEPMNCGSDTIS